MTAFKRLATQELQTAFAKAADGEIKRRTGRTKTDLARARRDAALQRTVDQAAAVKAKADAAYEKKIIRIFEAAKKIYDKAFGDNPSFAVSIKNNQIKIEHLDQNHHQSRSTTAPQFSEPAYIHGRFGKIITVKDGKLSQRRWGMDVDPQYRNYPVSLEERDLQEALLGPVIAFGSQDDLRKVKALTTPAKKAPVQNARKPRA